MRTENLVLKNLARRKGRTVLNSIGLIMAIAVIVVTVTISNSMEIKIGEEVEKYGPNIVVTPDTKSINVPYGSVTIGSSTFDEAKLTSLETIPNAVNIRIISPKLFGQTDYGESNLLMVGVNAGDERLLKVWWEINGESPEPGSDETLLGSQVFSALELSIGSSIELNDRAFTVTGYLSETGSNDDYTVFVPLATAQDMMGLPGKVSVVDIGALCSDCPVEDISQQIMDAIPSVKATPVKQAVETRMMAVEQAANFSLGLASIVLVAGCIGVMNTMVSSVHLRRREIGVFLSLGADALFVYRIFLFEAVLLGLAGGLLGAGLGVASSVLLGPLVLNTATSISNVPTYVVPLSLGISVLSCLIASLYPTWMATKIDPVSALKAI
ncbi:FtsX-like permease family protein [Candidatus Bathyarchaeota archaeon]|jgi:putative ABC transport system permease protein|nr:FtsX-like permease family protein [Candidatus Bathyarchaeota archaeon]MBT4320147.1 FtsX-like permease family protein [Candidatus Bathyarchaeota archaeon]MBT4424799.1 FtsX-like permease family protein [Candidatus Bathyarchaeota archaeon]MBT7188012.1 FtsX-like permease family protein [Candidatus Bathyarchaeota archaeon]MBT7346294.1 FtsX-like permease family protein [Candidatus Bathyarchaeota archaeon]